MQTWEVVDGLQAKRYQIIPVAVQRTYESGAGANGKSVRLFSFCSIAKNKPLKDDRSSLILTSRVHQSDWPTEDTLCRLTHFCHPTDLPHSLSVPPLTLPFISHDSLILLQAISQGTQALPFFLNPCAPWSLCEPKQPSSTVSRGRIKFLS